MHLPFCAAKCHYCDFYSIVAAEDRHASFTHALVRELETLAPFAAKPIETIFIGGGTPTLLAPDLWNTLLDALNRLFDRLTNLRMDPDGDDPHIRGQVSRSPTSLPVLFDTKAG